MMSHARPSGFSFLELLLVCLILLIVSAVLYPAIQSAHSHSESVACTQNLRQLVLAVLQYEQDRGHYPAGRQFLNYSGIPGAATDMIKWSNAIVPYLRGDPSAVSSKGGGSAFAPAPDLAAHPKGDEDPYYPETYRCPFLPKWDRAGLNMSYGYNYQYLGNADPLTVVTAGAKAGTVHFPVRRTMIPRPDRTICIADSDGTGVETYISAATNPSGPDVSRLGAFAYLLDPTFLPAWSWGSGPVPAVPVLPGDPAANMGPAAGGLTVDGAGNLQLAAGDPTHQGYRSVVSRRHHGMSNVGFLDGHIQVIAREEVFFRPASAPAGGNRLYLSNELWNGTGLDNDLDGNGLVEPAKGESVLDENEAFTRQGAPNLSPLVSANYDPTSVGTGYGQLTGLRGLYEAFGPGYDITAAIDVASAGQLGPTFPHVSPFSILDSAAQQ